MKKIDFNIQHILTISYTLLLILTFIVFLLLCYNGIHNYSPNNSIEYDETLIDFNVGWFDEKHKPVTLNYFKENAIFENESEQIIYHKIPNSVKMGDSICFRSLSCIVTLYIDNKPVLTTPYKDMLFSCDSPGSVWSFYKFKNEDLGKELKMKVKLCYDDSSCYIENMYVGNPVTYVFNYLKSSLFSILATIITLFLGILFVVADAYVNIEKPVKEHTLLQIGLFAIHMAVWCLFSTHVIELFYPGASQSVQYISCVALFLIPYQTLYFARSTFSIKKDTAIKYASALILALYVLATILQLTGIADYHETLKLTHLSLAIGIITLIYTLTITHIHGGINLFKMRKQKNRLGFMITTIFIISFLIIGVIFDLILFYSGEQINVGIFTRYSVIFVIIYLGLLASHNLFDILKQLNDSELTRKLAYKDNLTNIGNRTAFTRDFNNINDSLDKHEKVAIVSFDVNNLKILNDTLGHAMGDELIKKASEIISDSFENEFSTVYRIGGDEFVVIIDDKNADKIYELSKALFISNIDEYNYNEDKLFEISIAYGCAFYEVSEKCEYTNLNDVLKASDEYMYNQKQKIKHINK